MSLVIRYSVAFLHYLLAIVLLRLIKEPLQLSFFLLFSFFFFLSTPGLFCFRFASATIQFWTTIKRKKSHFSILAKIILIYIYFHNAPLTLFRRRFSKRLKVLNPSTCREIQRKLIFNHLTAAYFVHPKDLLLLLSFFFSFPQSNIQ